MFEISWDPTGVTTNHNMVPTYCSRDSQDALETWNAGTGPAHTCVSSQWKAYGGCGGCDGGGGSGGGFQVPAELIFSVARLWAALVQYQFEMHCSRESWRLLRLLFSQVLCNLFCQAWDQTREGPRLWPKGALLPPGLRRYRINVGHTACRSMAKSAALCSSIFNRPGGYCCTVASQSIPVIPRCNFREQLLPSSSAWVICLNGRVIFPNRWATSIRSSKHLTRCGPVPWAPAWRILDAVKAKTSLSKACAATVWSMPCWTFGDSNCEAAGVEHTLFMFFLREVVDLLDPLVMVVHPPEHDRTEPRRPLDLLDLSHESCVKDGLLEDFDSALRCIQIAPASLHCLELVWTTKRE